MPNGYNQYIGMRYVPLIMGTWTDTVNYEPMVVVAYNGNSYISKTYVPAGTLPTNETYWMLAANYNAQVEQYRQEVRQYQQTVDGFSGDISGIETSVGNLSGRVDDITGDITTINNEITNLTVGNVILGYATFAPSASAVSSQTVQQVTGSVNLNNNQLLRFRRLHPDKQVTVNVVGAWAEWGDIHSINTTFTETGTIAGGNYSAALSWSCYLRNLGSGNRDVNARVVCLIIGVVSESE